MPSDFRFNRFWSPNRRLSNMPNLQRAMKTARDKLWGPGTDKLNRKPVLSALICIPYSWRRLCTGTCGTPISLNDVSSVAIRLSSLFVTTWAKYYCWIHIGTDVDVLGMEGLGSASLLVTYHWHSIGAVLKETSIRLAPFAALPLSSSLDTSVWVQHIFIRLSQIRSVWVRKNADFHFLFCRQHGQQSLVPILDDSIQPLRIWIFCCHCR